MNLHILIAGRKRLTAPFCAAKLDATAQALKDQIPVLQEHGRIAVYVTDDTGVAHIIANKPALSREEETDPDFVISPSGNGFVACYRFEEDEEFNGEAFGFGPDPELAIADLVRRFPREA